MIARLLHNQVPGTPERSHDLFVAEDAQVLIRDVEHGVRMSACMQQDPLAHSLYPLHLTAAGPVLQASALHQQQRWSISRELAKTHSVSIRTMSQR